MTPQRSSRRLLRQALASAFLVLFASAISVSLLRGASLNVASGKIPHRPGRFSGAGTDTQGVFPSTRYTHTGSSSFFTDYSDNFDADTVNGRRYVLELVNNGASQVHVSINGQEFIGTSELSSHVLREIDVVQCALGSGGNELDVSVKGSGSTSVDVKIVRVSDPTFIVYGPKTFTQPNPAAKQVDTFSIVHPAKSPYTLRVINGSGSGSNRVTNATLSVNGVAVMGSSDLGTGRATKTYNVTLDTASVNRDTLYNQTATGTYLSLRFTATDSTPPALTVSVPADTYSTQGGVRVSGSVTDETYGILTVDTTTTSSRAPIPTPGAFTDSLPLPNVDKRYSVKVHAINSAWLTADVSRMVIRDTHAPDLNVKSPAADTTTSLDSISVVGNWTDSSRVTLTVDGDTTANLAPPYIGISGAFSYKYGLDAGPNRILVRAIDAAGNITQVWRVVFKGALSEGLDSLSVPSTALRATAQTPFLDNVKFIYTGGSALQLGVTTDSISANLAAVVRGRVVGRDWGPIGNDTVEVVGHPEYGYELTRKDGQFDMVVNGGGPLTFRFAKSGYLEMQRLARPAPNDYFTLGDVAIIGKTVRQTTIDSSAVAVARGRFASDGNGDRDVRLVFPRGVAAVVHKSATDSTVFTHMHVRATEFTIGANGPNAMPATLPASSAYTYCLDLRLYEADSISEVSNALPLNTTFNQPVPVYVKNFLHLPIGAALPVGYYDQQAAQWKAMPDGVVGRIVSLNPGGTADSIDTRGTGHGDPQTRLDSLGITSDELVALKAQYAVGDTVWRITTTHFSVIDVNLNEAGFLRALSATFLKWLRQLALIAKACLTTGSIIDCQNRILGERVGVVGTPYTLNYRSIRSIGDKAVRTARIPLIGSAVPGGLNKITVTLDVAGRHYVHYHNPPFSTSTPPDTIAWDGLDVYGRRVRGSVNARIGVGYQFDGNYAAGSGDMSMSDPAASGPSVGAPSAERAVGVTVWSRQTISLGAPGAESDGLGGWTISPHHFFDRTGSGTVYLGDGSMISGDQLPPTIHEILSSSCYGSPVLGPDGSLYLADACQGAIVRMLPSGTIQRLAGETSPGHYGSDGPATSTHLENIKDLALGADGTIYFVSDANSPYAMLGKVSPGGTIKKILGNGTDTHTGTGDGGPVASATLTSPTAIAVGSDGSIFFAEGDDHKIRRIAPNGMITRYAGTGSSSSYAPADPDSSGKATLIRINSPTSLTTDPDGNLYFCTGTSLRIWKVTPDGTLTRFARIDSHFVPFAMSFGPDGAAYIASYDGNPASVSGAWQYQLIYRRDVDSSYAVIAGGGQGYVEGGPALGSEFDLPGGIAVAPDGSYYVTNTKLYRISRTLATPNVNEVSIPSPDGSEVYFFGASGDSSGLHLRTRDALTGAVRYRFDYNAGGQLLAIHDVSGLTTTIQRGSGGVPVAVLGPFGHRTRCNIDANGYLTSVTDTLGQSLGFTYNSDSLLASYTDSRGNISNFSYDMREGRLHEDDAPASTGGSQVLDITDAGLTRTVTRTTAEGRVTAYATATLNNGTVQRRITADTGLLTYESDSTDSREFTWTPSGMAITDSLKPDARFGMTAPLLARSTSRTPAGIAHVIDVARSIPAGFNPPQTKGVWSEDVSINSRTAFHSQFSADTLVFRSLSPLGRITAMSVDTGGRPRAEFVRGVDSIRYAYNSNGQLIHLQQGGRTLRCSYDAHGRPSTMTDTLGRATTLGYDDLGRLTTQTLPDSQVVSFAYDSAGNLASITPPGRSPHLFAFNAFDLTARYITPSAGTEVDTTTYTYNKDRELTQILRPDGVAIALTYESGTSRLRAITIPRGSTTFKYRTTGQVDSITSPDGEKVIYAYDGSLPRAETYRGPVVGRVDVTYDSDFRPSTQAVDSTLSITFAYDLDGLLVGAGVDSIHRDAVNGVVDSTYLNGFTATSSQHFNSAGEPLDLHYGWNGSGYLQTYSRDSLGRLVSLSETVGGDTTRVYAYVYTTGGRLREVDRGTNVLARYDYDANGNRIVASGPSGDTTGATFDGQDRLMRLGPARYTYTRNGELQQRISGTDTTRYTYDELGNLIKVVLPSGTRIEYVIDGQNRRVGRKVNGALKQGWLYQNTLSPVAELDSVGNIVARYVYGSRTSVPDYVVRGGTTFRIIADYLGSVRLVVDATTGAVAESIGYDGFGRVLYDANPGVVSLGYGGGLYDAATGLVRFGVRDYDPDAGRWTRKDPIRFAGGSTNLMAYVADPINRLDTSGMNAADDAAGGFLDGLTCGHATKWLHADFVNKKSATYKAARGVGIGAAVTALSLATAGVATAAADMAGAELVAEADAEVTTAAQVADDFFLGTQYSDKVLAQIATGDFHAFPSTVEAFADAGTTSTIVGGDGVTVQVLEIPGGYAGRSGVFEFIKTADGTITHRLFRPF